MNISVINFGTNFNDLSHNKNNPESLPISSGHWYLNQTIEINGNSEWNTTAFTYDWCSGSGTWNDPYVIENVTIDGQNTNDDGIVIQNSDVYFKINNCTIKNVNSCAIALVNVSNSVITKNTCNDIITGLGSDIGIGCILLTDSTISGNICNNNLWGIYIQDGSENVIISKNQLNNNYYYDIRVIFSKNIDIINNTGHIELYCVNSSVISRNNIMNRQDISLMEGGIKLLYDCWNNIITANYIFNNSVGIGFVYGSSSSTETNSIIGNIFSNNSKNIYPRNIKVKSVGNLMDGFLDPIIISDDNSGDVNWSQFSSFAWAKGSGTFTDPYIIENIKFNGYGLNKTAGLTIENSASYFIITNCKFFDFLNGKDCAGIKLKNVENGKLIDNECWNIIGDGIRLEFSNDNIITKNIVSYNRNGIYVKHDPFEEFRNNITKNTAEYNDIGFYITNIKANSYLYPIRDNLIQNNHKYGMVFNNCMFINISHNNVNANNHGIHLDGCYYTVITRNIINSNNGYGIILEESLFNQVNLNTLINNKECILEINSTANNIGNNTCINRIDIPGYNLFFLIFPVTFTTIILIILTKKRRI